MRLMPILLLLLLAGCPDSKSGKTPQTNPTPKTPSLTVTLLRTDLGLADGEMVRDADAALQELAESGDVIYTPVGDLPLAMENEGGTGDIGLPDAEPQPGSKLVGLMTSAEVKALAGQVKECDLLVVGNSVAANIVLKEIAAGQIKVGALVVLDDTGAAISVGQTTVLRFSYDIKEAAYLLGVAAGVSSRSQAYAMFTSTSDPNSNELIAAFENGVRNRMSGGNVYHAQITPGVDDIVAPDDFKRAFESIMGVPNRTIDHFIVFGGRATPSIMYGLSSKPTNGFLLGGYGDYTQVRPARIVGCIVKRPGVGLKKLLAGVNSLDEVKQRFGDGITLGFEDGAVDVTDFSGYANYNPDAEDIEDAVKQVRSEILGGEIEVLPEADAAQ